jgi:Icc-related predicted phosphoesterase
MRMVVISDTHGRHDGWNVPDGDVLVHCGDLTKRGTLAQLRAAATFVRSLPHQHKIVIAGNHDFGLQRKPAEARATMSGLTYLEDQSTEIDGVRFYGSPWQPWFYDWAFNLRRGEPLARVWAAIPDDTEVLVTHGPPYGHGDRVERPPGELVGCRDLLARVRDVRPKVHCFGHIHESAGVTTAGGTLFVNASICDLDYRPTLPARVLDRIDGVWAVVDDGNR